MLKTLKKQTACNLSGCYITVPTLEKENSVVFFLLVWTSMSIPLHSICIDTENPYKQIADGVSSKMLVGGMTVENSCKSRKLKQMLSEFSNSDMTERLFLRSSAMTKWLFSLAFARHSSSYTVALLRKVS
jgi:hypothetical protein